MIEFLFVLVVIIITNIFTYYEFRKCFKSIKTEDEDKSEIIFISIDKSLIEYGQRKTKEENES